MSSPLHAPHHLPSTSLPAKSSCPHQRLEPRPSSKISNVADLAISYLSRFLRITRDNLDLVRRKLMSIFAFELHILHDECPDVVAETVGLKMTLR